MMCGNNSFRPSKCNLFFFFLGGGMCVKIFLTDKISVFRRALSTHEPMSLSVGADAESHFIPRGKGEQSWWVRFSSTL